MPASIVFVNSIFFFILQPEDATTTPLYGRRKDYPSVSVQAALGGPPPGGPGPGGPPPGGPGPGGPPPGGPSLGALG
tara:strand:- start:408 stop:638 length:231 start_codon:yes stop_codon:yes gene_type:complete